MRTVHLTSIYHPQIGGNFAATPGGPTNLFMVALTNSWSELVNTIIKKVMAALEGGPEFAPRAKEFTYLHDSLSILVSSKI